MGFWKKKKINNDRTTAVFTIVSRGRRGLRLVYKINHKSTIVYATIYIIIIYYQQTSQRYYIFNPVVRYRFFVWSEGKNLNAPLFRIIINNLSHYTEWFFYYEPFETALIPRHFQHFTRWELLVFRSLLKTI